jgi:predicted negative regulator of RcsB-dependent stress response
MEKAVNNVLKPNDVLYDHFADILFANGDKAEARNYWQKAIDAGGDEAVLKVKMAQ